MARKTFILSFTLKEATRTDRRRVNRLLRLYFKGSRVEEMETMWQIETDKYAREIELEAEFYSCMDRLQISKGAVIHTFIVDATGRHLAGMRKEF